MKKSYLLLLFSAFLFPALTRAQLSGTINVPNATYATLASVVTALNTQGVGTGGVTINLLSGNPQTAPAGGYLLGSTLLNASTSAAKRIVINGNGNVITAPTGVSTTVDGIFIIRGTDYLTIDNLGLTESTSNTTATTAMEWGYALVNLNATAGSLDGCQNDTIRNCNITLNRTIATASSGIYTAHIVYTTTTALLPTVVGDLHSFNGYYNNNISNVVRGIYLNGPAVTAVTLYDQNNDIGGFTAATGNTITNCIGSNYSGVGPVTATYQQNLNVSYNTLSNITNGGVAAIGGAWGIYAYGPGSTFTVNNNNINLSETPISTAYYVYGIYSNALTTTMTAQNNKITLTEGFASTGGVPCYGVLFANGNNCTVANDTFNLSQGNGTGTSYTYGIYSTYVGAVNLNANVITLSGTATGSIGQFYGIAAGGVATSETITNNRFTNIATPAASYGGYAMLIYDVNASGTKTITGNKIVGGYTHTSSVPFYGIYNANSVASNAGTCTISGNNFSGLTLTGIGGAYMVYEAPVTGPQNYVISNDTLSNITSTANAPVYAVYTMGGVNSDVFSNQISDINTGGSVYGVYVNGNTANNVYRNKIYNLNTTGANSVYGVTIAAGTTNKIYNNLIGNLSAGTAGGSDVIRGIYLASTTAGTTHGVYYNTVYLNATSTGTNFSSTGLYHATSTTSTAGTLDLRNNIIINLSTPTGSGNTAAIRRSASGTSNFAATSDRNILYAGTPAATRLIMTDGSNNYQTLANYTAAVAPAEANSITENSPFASTTGSAANYLHFNPGSFTYAESSGANVTGITTDFDADIRQGNTGYTGNGTAPDIGADEFNNCSTVTITTQPVNDTACSASTAHFNVVANPATAFYQWQVNSGSGFTDVTNGGVYSGAQSAGLVVTNPPFSMNGYSFRVRVSTGPTCTPTISNVVTLAVTSSPSAAVTIVGPTTFCQGDSVKLSVPTGTSLSYQWKFNTNNIVGATSNTYTARATGSYTVVVSSTNGCSATSTPVNVVVNPRPDTYITYNSALDFCEGGGIVLNALPATGATYQWYIDNTAIPGGTGQYQLITTQGQVTVVATNTLNCSNPSQPLSITVHPKPQPVISVSGDTLSAQAGYASYQWQLNNVSIGTATNRRYILTSTGTYTVIVTDAFGCENRSVGYYVGGLGIAATSAAANGIRIYPNPASQYLTVENMGAAKIEGVNILNSLGQLVYGSAATGNAKMVIPVGSLPAGIYSLRVHTNAGVVIGKVLVQP